MTPTRPLEGDATRRRRDRRRWLPRHVDGLAPARARARARRRAARGGRLRPRPERPERRVLRDAVGRRAHASRAGGRRSGARRLPRVRGRRCAGSARGAPRTSVDAWFREAPMLRGRDDGVAGRVSWDGHGPRRRRARRRRGGRLGVGRRGAGALRVAALPRRRALPPERDRASRPARARPPREAARARRAHPRAHGRDAVSSERAAPRPAPGASVPSAAVLAVNSAAASFPGYRLSLAVASSHIVLTEPIPDVLDELGWTGGEAIVDSRTLVHYTRTTRDGRIVFGWGGGTMGMGGRAVRPARARPERRRGDRARASPLLPADARPRGDARLGRPDRRLADAPADLREPRPRPPRVRLHRERRRARRTSAARSSPASRSTAATSERASRSSSRRESCSRPSRSGTQAARSSGAR